MIKFLKRILVRKTQIEREAEKDTKEVEFVNADYSYSGRMMYHESRDMFGYHNDFHREYEYWNWRDSE